MIAALEHELHGKIRAYEAAADQHTATATILAARKAEVQALQLKLHPKAARATTTGNHTQATAYITQQKKGEAAGKNPLMHQTKIPFMHQDNFRIFSCSKSTIRAPNLRPPQDRTCVQKIS